MQDIPPISDVLSRLDRLRGAREEARRQLNTCEESIHLLEEGVKELDLVSVLLRGMVDSEISSAVQALQKLQSEGLASIFADQKLSVEAQVEIKWNKVHLTLLTLHEHDDGTIIKGVADSTFGGSVSTVESILMRVLVLLRRGLRPVLVLDEGLAAFDDDYAERIGKFLGALCDKLDMDILMVTHNRVLFQSAQRAYTAKGGSSGARFDLVRTQ
jgi:hypothetical protein